jgi:hypothetical protein
VTIEPPHDGEAAERERVGARPAATEV